MSTHGSEHNPAQPPNSLQSMLARLRGMMQTLKSIDPPLGKAEESRSELLPTWDVAKVVEVAPSLETAAPPETSQGDAGGSPPSGEAPCAPAPSSPDEIQPPAEVGGILCTACGSVNPAGQSYCEACGWIFPPDGTRATTGEEKRIRDRFELIKLIGERGACQLFHAIDQAGADTTAVAVLIMRAPVSQSPVEPIIAATVPIEAVLADAETPATRERISVPLVPPSSNWPSLPWYLDRVELTKHGTWPRYLEQFEEDGYVYLVMEEPAGLSLWDAWDDPQATEAIRFGWLIQIAETMQELHSRGAMLETLRPENVLIARDGRVRISDLTQLLPCPLPEHAQLRAGLYSAPELILASEKADARADLYTFGAMLFALHLGRELTETDFELQGVPKPILQRFADCHPVFGRLISKTFCRDVNLRFPTFEASAEDHTGFAELLTLLRRCQATLDRVRLEVSAWSTTGMVRTGNEDAFAVLQACQCYDDQFADHVLLLAADGMGGSDAGEVAARMTIQSLLEKVSRHKLWNVFGGRAPTDSEKGEATHFLDSATVRLSLLAMISEVNREVFAAAREGSGRRGMGCTLEFVYVGGDAFAVGHVGDSRTYHFHRGQLRQVTEDQTWVQRMVAIGAMTPQEALDHPRRSELQQAIGGQPEVQPMVYEGRLVPGDALLVCSDGVTGHLSEEMLQEIMQRNTSAEACARQIINWANLHGGSDNSTALVVRAR